MTTLAPAPATTAGSQSRDALLTHLVAGMLADADDCTIVGFSGSGRCLEQAVALRWEGGFTDLVCEEHALRAIDRGALVVYPTADLHTGDQVAGTPSPAVHHRLEYGVIVDRTSKGLGYFLAGTTNDHDHAANLAQTAEARFSFPAEVKQRHTTATDWQPVPASPTSNGQG